MSLALGTTGSGFDTVLAVYQGASLTNLLIVALLRTASAVKLETRIDSGFLELKWPGGEYGYTIEGSDTLGTNGWSMVLPIDGQRKLLVSPASGNRFFRLRKTAQ